MEKQVRTAGRDAVFLTAAAAGTQLLGFGYRVVLSRMVGAEVMGLYQLLMPVYSVLLSCTAVGLMSALSNLTAQHLALGNRRGAGQTRNACLILFLCLILPVGAMVVLLSDPISVVCLGDARTRLGLMLLVPCTLLTGVENLHKHFFYGAGQVRTPALVEGLEQVVRITAVLGLLALFLPQYPERTVGLIVTGMVICEIGSAGTLLVLYHRRKGTLVQGGPGEARDLCRMRIAAIAVPVGLNALLGNLLGAVNAAMIPRKLVEAGLERSQAISQFGVISGMTMPMLALPTVFLGALNLVMLPRVARAYALKREEAVRRLLDKGITVVAVLTLPSMAAMTILGKELGAILFHQPVGDYLAPLALVMAMSCYCSVMAAGLNMVGRQRWVAMVSLLGGIVQLGVTLWLVPVPEIGMGGYVAGALVATGLESGLCFWRLLRVTNMKVQGYRWLLAPGLAAALAALTGNLLLRWMKDQGAAPIVAVLAVLVFGGVIYWAALQAQGIRIETLFGRRKKKTPTVD